MMRYPLDPGKVMQPTFPGFLCFHADSVCNIIVQSLAKIVMKRPLKGLPENANRSRGVDSIFLKD